MPEKSYTTSQHLKIRNYLTQQISKRYDDNVVDKLLADEVVDGDRILFILDQAELARQNKAAAK